ncbi:MAG: lipid-A-disaccharide synthase, partial [Deltaproteobacteria bacterium]|nr:lipid-A-disaccharide synthase [Deltaproteobacteria bacterium]
MMSGPLRVMISAGELSGDMHGAALAMEAKASGIDIDFFGLGGDRMAAAGVDLRFHARETAVMGLTEVLGSLARLLKIRKSLADMVATERPQALVLIDSPDLNHALAKAAYKAGVPVIYYICPQVWAWRKGRLKWLGKLVRRRAVLFPFEAEFYQKEGLTADLVGHPLLDEMPLGLTREGARAALGLDHEAEVLAVLPGSRQAVAARLAMPMFGAVDILLGTRPNLIPVIPRPETLPPGLLQDLAGGASQRVRDRLRLFEGRSHEILKAADAALLVAGTSTVEGAILGTPMVAAYKVSSLSWRLANLLVKVPYVSIANLLVGREIVPELLQSRATPVDLANEILAILEDGPRRQAMISGLGEAARLLGGPGASARTLAIIVEETRVKMTDQESNEKNNLAPAGAHQGEAAQGECQALKAGLAKANPGTKDLDKDLAKGARAELGEEGPRLTPTERLWALIRPHMPVLVLAMISMALAGVSTAGMAHLIKPLLDDVFFYKDSSRLFFLTFLTLGIFSATGAFTFFQSYLMNKVGYTIVNNLRVRLFS